MPKYNVRIKGMVDGDNPELAYLNNAKNRLETADDVLEYLTDFLAEELAFETIDIQVVSIDDRLIHQSRASKILK